MMRVTGHQVEGSMKATVVPGRNFAMFFIDAKGAGAHMMRIVYEMQVTSHQAEDMLATSAARKAQAAARKGMKASSCFAYALRAQSFRRVSDALGSRAEAQRDSIIAIAAMIVLEWSALYAALSGGDKTQAGFHLKELLWLSNARPAAASVAWEAIAARVGA